MTDLGELHRQIWLATTEKGAVCEIILTADQGGGGCVAHFETDVPLTVNVDNSDPAHLSGSHGPAFLWGLAKAEVTGVDVEKSNGAISPASFANSAWYWETPPGRYALRDLALIVHLADGSAQRVSLASATGLTDSAFDADR
jgi:hypothetical protein